MLKLIYFVPESHLDITKNAVFNAGAGSIGNYSHCAWQVQGIGQFQPNDHAQPFLGQSNQLEQVAEWRVETIVCNHDAKQVKRALIESHPYEEPAFEFLQVLDV